MLCNYCVIIVYVMCTDIKPKTIFNFIKVFKPNRYETTYDCG